MFSLSLLALPRALAAIATGGRLAAHIPWAWILNAGHEVFADSEMLRCELAEAIVVLLGPLRLASAPLKVFNVHACVTIYLSCIIGGKTWLSVNLRKGNTFECIILFLMKHAHINYRMYYMMYTCFGGTIKCTQDSEDTLMIPIACFYCKIANTLTQMSFSHRWLSDGPLRCVYVVDKRVTLDGPLAVPLTFRALCSICLVDSAQFK